MKKKTMVITIIIIISLIFFIYSVEPFLANNNCKSNEMAWVRGSEYCHNEKNLTLVDIRWNEAYCEWVCR